MDKKARVLVAIDGSGQSDNALQWYIDFVHKPSYRVELLHCMEPLHMIGEFPSANQYDAILNQSKDMATKIEDSYRKILAEKQIVGHFRTVLAHRPGEVIVDTLEKEDFDMVVLGTRGMSKVRRFAMGSVSDFVMHHAPCPVLVCRHRETASSAPLE